MFFKKVIWTLMRIKEIDFISTSNNITSFSSIVLTVLQAEWIHCLSFWHLQPKVCNSDTDQIRHHSNPICGKLWWQTELARQPTSPDNKIIVTSELRMFIYPNHNDHNCKVHTNKLTFTELFYMSTHCSKYFLVILYSNNYSIYQRKMSYLYPI